MSQQQYDELLGELYAAGVLDTQFAQLQLLEDDANPDFVEEMVELYFTDTKTKLDRLGELVNETPVNMTELDSTFHQLKGSSASIGANAMAVSCANCREQFQNNNLEQAKLEYEKVLLSFNELNCRLKDLMNLKRGAN